MNLRSFFKQANLLAAAGFPALPADLSRKERIHIGAQTNAFGVPTKPFSRLLEVAGVLGQLGYQGFETNLASIEEGASQPAKCRRAFEARHIQLIAAFSGGMLDNKEAARQTIERNRRVAGYTAAMGASFLVFNGPGFRHHGGREDMTRVHYAMAGLNRLGEVVQKEGLKLAIHNEWQPMAGHPPAESFVLKDTDPKLVWLCFDVGNPYGHVPNWDPVAFSREHFRRIAIYHLKDVARNAQGQLATVPFGTGKINLKGVVAPLLDSNWEGWLTVEEEGIWPRGLKHPKKVMGECRQYLRKVVGV
ncbi:MAG: sugar phosphate isomerase/epimerase family protein [Terriglobia bacterium]